GHDAGRAPAGAVAGGLGAVRRAVLDGNGAGELAQRPGGGGGRRRGRRRPARLAPARRAGRRGVGGGRAGAPRAGPRSPGAGVGVGRKEYCGGYLVGASLGLAVALAALAVAPFAGWFAGRGRRWLLPACAALLLTAAAVGHGLPNPARIRPDLDDVLGRYTP